MYSSTMLKDSTTVIVRLLKDKVNFNANDILIMLRPPSLTQQNYLFATPYVSPFPLCSRTHTENSVRHFILSFIPVVY